MDVIARTWTIYVCADCGEHQHDHNRIECWKCGSGNEWEEIGVVPASQLRGAVEALRAIVAYAAPPHPEPCGTDLCLLCLIEGTAQPHTGGQ